jgi:hypothetical protein
MLARLLSAAVVIAIGFGAGGVRAGTLTSATWITELPGMTAERIALAVPIVASGTSTSSSVAVSLLMPPFRGSAFGTGGPIATYRAITLSGAQMLTATPSMAAATMAIDGRASAKVAQHVAKGVNASMNAPGRTTLIRIPLSVGGDGSVRETADLIWFFYVTVDFYGWSPGVRTFTGLTLRSSALPSVMASGSFDLTAMGGGSVLLVAPTRLSIDEIEGPGLQRRQVYLSTLRLQFVPEPGTFLLLGAGGLGLLLWRRRS